MSRVGVAHSRGAIGLSAVCDGGIPDHTHLLFFKCLRISFIWLLKRYVDVMMFWSLLCYLVLTIISS